MNLVIRKRKLEFENSSEHWLRRKIFHKSPCVYGLDRGLSWSACLIDKKLTVNYCGICGDLCKEIHFLFSISYALCPLPLCVIFSPLTEKVKGHRFSFKREFTGYQWNSNLSVGIFKLFRFHNTPLYLPAKSNINLKDKYNLIRLVNKL